MLPRADFGPCAFLHAFVIVSALLSTNASASGWGGMLGIGSDNVFRGQSLTSSKPGWFADIHYVGDAWSFGVGASAERPPFQTPGAQFTAYADRRWRLDGDWSAKLGFVHYESPNNFWRSELRYNELTAAWGYRNRWRLTLAVSPDTTALHEDLSTSKGWTAAVETSWHQPLGDRYGIDLGVGHAILSAIDAPDYSYAHAGASATFGRIYVFSTLVWTDSSNWAYNARADTGARWVTSLLWTF
jgi:hypothetical protein